MMSGENVRLSPPWSCLFLSLILAGSTFAGTGDNNNITIPLGNKSTVCQVLSESNDGYHFRLSIGQLQAQKIITNAGNFVQLSVPGFVANGDIGGPRIPRFQRLLALPFGADIKVEIITKHTQEVDLATYGLIDLLAPTQPAIPKNQNPAEHEWVFNPTAYATKSVLPEPTRVVPLGKLRALSLGRLEVAPITYLPQENKLLVADEIEVRVEFTGGDPLAGSELRSNTASPFFWPVYATVQGAEIYGHFPVAKADDPITVQGLVTMVIITPSEYVSYLTEFVNWKTQRGFVTVIGEIGTPEVGATAESIKEYINNLYISGTTSQPSPTFVVFVGDIEQMPSFSIDGNTSDRPFCDIDDDNIPDLFYGRLPAANASQLAAMLTKTIDYDKCNMTDLSYLEEVTLVAGSDAYHAPAWGNGQINYGTTYYFNADHDIDSHVYLYPQSSSFADEIIQTVDDGVGFINYTAHAGVSGWSNPSFSVNDVNDLTNDEHYCFAIGNCCHSAAFAIGESFGESWLRVANAGGIGYVGATDETYWDPDFYWAVGSTESIVAEPDRDDTTPGVYDRLFDTPEVGGNIVSGAVNFFGNLAVQESDAEGQHNLYWDIYHLMGDPSLNIHLGVPGDNTVTTPDQIYAEEGYIDVTATPGSYVGLSQEDVFIGGSTVNSAGDARVRFIKTPNGNQELMVVVTVQNTIPFSRYISVTPSTELVLRPIFPNPVEMSAQETEIPLTFRTTVPGHVTLFVYDLAGCLVRKIVNGSLPAEEHRRVWDGYDDSNQSVASGTYFIQLITGGNVSSQQVTVIR